MLRIAFTSSENQSENFLKLPYWNAFIHIGKKLNLPVFPVILPTYTDTQYISWCINTFDGFVITGGDDIDPTFYGEDNTQGLSRGISSSRDRFDCVFARALAEQPKPVLGICRGMQVMNVILGGTLWQDIACQQGLENHCGKNAEGIPIHSVQAMGWLAETLGTSHIVTNSYHHQAVKEVGKGTEILAYSQDGVVEAIRLRNHPFYVGLQWHPEREAEEYSSVLAQRFLEACQRDS